MLHPNLKIRDMPLQDGKHRAIAFSAHHENVNALINQPSENPKSVAPKISTGDSHPSPIMAGHRIEKTAATLSLQDQSYLYQLKKAMALKLHPSNLCPFRGVVEHEPILQRKLGGNFSQGFQFMLLPPPVRQQIAVLLIKLGCWEIVGTCKRLRIDFGPLVSIHGICRIIIGSPKLVDPRILRTDCLQNIMNIKLFVLRTGNSSTSTILDTNMNLLPLFRGNLIIRKRLDLTLVGLTGISWAITEGFLHELPPIQLFEEFIFNIRILHPRVDSSLIKLNWRNNMYNSSFNDMFIATKPFEKHFGPFCLEHRGAVFRPYDHWKLGLLKDITSASSYSNDEGIFRFNKKQVDRHGRIIYRKKDNERQVKLPPAHAVFQHPEEAHGETPKVASTVDFQDYERRVSAPAALVNQREPVAIAPRQTGIAQHGHFSVPALKLDTSMTEASTRPTHQSQGALNNQIAGAITTRRMPTSLVGTLSAQDGAEALVALSSNPYVTPVSAASISTNHLGTKQITPKSIQVVNRSAVGDQVDLPSPPNGRFLKGRFGQNQSSHDEPTKSRKHRRSSSSDSLNLVDLASPLEADNHHNQHRHHRRQFRNRDSKCTSAAAGSCTSAIKPKDEVHGQKVQNAAQSANLVLDPHRSSASPSERRLEQVNQPMSSTRHHTIIHPQFHANGPNITSRKRKIHAASSGRHASDGVRIESDLSTGIQKPPNTDRE